MNEYCKWEEDEDGDGLWHTGCKEIHILMEGTPTENKYKFCPYCGKEIEEVKV